jgi:hypothetical protein
MGVEGIMDSILKCADGVQRVPKKKHDWVTPTYILFQLGCPLTRLLAGSHCSNSLTDVRVPLGLDQFIPSFF